MRGKRREFYADNQDIMNLLKEFDNLGNFKYVAHYSEINEEVDIFYNAVDIYDKSICTPLRTSSGNQFSIFEEKANVIFREINLIDGSGKRTSLQTMLSDDSIQTAFGGEVGDNVLVMGDISTVANDTAVLDHFKRFKKLIESKSVRIGLPGQPHYLMAGAVQKAKQGWRLAQGKGWNVASDPVLPPEQLAKL
jgi:hypothetical protein